MSRLDTLGEKMMPIANKIGGNLYLTVLRDAFMLAFPLTMFGSFVVVFNNLPFWPDSLKSTFSNLFGAGQNATMSIMAVFVTFGIGYYLSKAKGVEGIFGGAVAFASFLILTPLTTDYVDEKTGKVLGQVQAIDLSRLGAKGMFVAMIAAFIAASIYIALTKKGFVIKMPDGVPPAVAKSFSALIPAFGALAFFMFVNAIVGGVFNTNVADEVYKWIQMPLVGIGTSYPGTMIAMFLTLFLWFFGLHGQIIVNSICEPLWNTNSLLNLDIKKKLASNVIHHSDGAKIVTKAFMDTFTVQLGGTGMTLVVAIILAFGIKKAQMRNIGRLGLAPGLFNVNEPIIFGLPIVLNAQVLIPWLLAPLVVTTVNYFAMWTNLVPCTTGAQVPWTIPIVISGFLATNSVLGSLLQIIDFAIVGIIWWPFLKLMDREPDTSKL
ncbi:MAG: PTS sugar transporter subunit IIC [Lactobacillales bacterium]|jgi:PTS system cellobiose-specific IIC component|nr:PTS sugar transporter subunit IIC [Lactobacillales bacterium]